MNYKERYRLSTEEIKNVVNTYYNINTSVQLYAIALYVRQEHIEENKWKFAAGRISSTPIESITMKYPKCALIARKLTIDTYDQLFSSITDKGLLIDPDFPCLQSLDCDHWREQLFPSLLDEDNWPKRRIEVKANDKVQMPYEKLIAYDLPYFENIGHMVKKLADIPECYVESGSEKGLLIIDIEDKRGRLQSRGGLLFPELNCEAGIVGYYKEKNEKIDVIHTKNCSLNWNLEEVEEYELFLVTKNHEVLDFITTNDNFHPSKNKKGVDKYRLEIETAIDSGEGEMVEFKADMDFRDVSNKTIELEKTVCALSNHKGGKLLFGVTDDGEVKGVTVK